MKIGMHVAKFMQNQKKYLMQIGFSKWRPKFKMAATYHSARYSNLTLLNINCHGGLSAFLTSKFNMIYIRENQTLEKSVHVARFSTIGG